MSSSNADPMYLQEFNEVREMDSTRQMTWRGLRGDLTEQFAWGIPTEQCLNQLASVDSLVEVGAGNGYWSYEIERVGGSVYPIDIDVPDDTWTTVHEMGYMDLDRSNVSNVLYCWPPANNDMALVSVEYLNPDTVFFVGKEGTTVTATEEFFEYMDENYAVECQFDLPSWSDGSDDFIKYVSD